MGELKTIIKRVQFIIVCLIIIGSIGWIKDIVKLTHCDFKEPYKAEIIYGVGVIPFVGAITGWMDIGE